jgi:RHS repeat-associated protein
MSRVTSFAYDARGRVTSTTFPSTLSETYSYDDAGNLLTKTDRKSNTTTFSYDVLNRLTRKQYQDGSGVDYVYDNASRMTQVTDGGLTGTYQFGYDNMGRLKQTTTTYTALPSTSFVVKYGFDAASNRSSMTDPQNGVTNYNYDTLNRLTSLTNPQSQQFTFSYDALSRRTQLTRPNGVNTFYTWDSQSLLFRLLNTKGTTTLDDTTYEHDSVGNLAGKWDTGTPAVYFSHNYDSIYQLLEKQRVTESCPAPCPPPGIGTMVLEQYSYDRVGNRLSMPGIFGDQNYTYNNSNQLTLVSDPFEGDVTYTYDNNGNLITRSSPSTSFSWDFENRLTQVTSGTGTTQYKYDPFGRRIFKSASPGSRFIYDGANLLEQVNASTGAVIVRYTQGQGIDEPLAQLRGSVTTYYQADEIGSITSLTNGSGLVTDTYGYTSFGSADSTGTTVNEIRYTGREFDSETGLYYYRARYYDQSIGRFLSEDPLGFGGGTNFYSYVHNNPAVNRDPLGLLEFKYHGTYISHGWGILMNDHTLVSPDTTYSSCECTSNGDYKLTGTVVFAVEIQFGSESRRIHELEHFRIMKDYFARKKPYYDAKYDRKFETLDECMAASKHFTQGFMPASLMKDIRSDIRDINKLQERHDDWFQNAIEKLGRIVK